MYKDMQKREKGLYKHATGTRQRLRTRFANQILVQVFTSVHFVAVRQLTNEIFILSNNDYNSQYYL